MRKRTVGKKAITAHDGAAPWGHAAGLEVVSKGDGVQLVRVPGLDGVMRDGGETRLGPLGGIIGPGYIATSITFGGPALRRNIVCDLDWTVAIAAAIVGRRRILASAAKARGDLRRVIVDLGMLGLRSHQRGFRLLKYGLRVVDVTAFTRAQPWQRRLASYLWRESFGLPKPRSSKPVPADIDLSKHIQAMREDGLV